MSSQDITDFIAPSLYNNKNDGGNLKASLQHYPQQHMAFCVGNKILLRWEKKINTGKKKKSVYECIP